MQRDRRGQARKAGLLLFSRLNLEWAKGVKNVSLFLPESLTADLEINLDLKASGFSSVSSFPTATSDFFWSKSVFFL